MRETFGEPFDPVVVNLFSANAPAVAGLCSMTFWPAPFNALSGIR